MSTNWALMRSRLPARRKLPVSTHVARVLLADLGGGHGFVAVGEHRSAREDVPGLDLGQLRDVFGDAVSMLVLAAAAQVLEEQARRRSADGSGPVAQRSSSGWGRCRAEAGLNPVFRSVAVW